MAFNEFLATRLRDVLVPWVNDIQEKKMFGGLSFLYKGKMSCGVVKDEMVFRVVEEKYEQALKEPLTRPMDFTGKIMKGFVFVDQEAVKSQEELSKWVELGIEHAERASKK